jgi:hypothetical protein
MLKFLPNCVLVFALLAAAPVFADQLDELVLAGDVSVSATAPDPPDTSGRFFLTLVPRTSPDGTLVELSFIMQTFIELPRAEMATGYSIREGEPGEGGPIVIDTFYSPDNPISHCIPDNCGSGQ